jgi:hypothetical protein
MGARIGAERGVTGARRVSPRAGWVLILGSRVVPRYCGSSLSHDVYQNSVIGDL